MRFILRGAGMVAIGLGLFGFVGCGQGNDTNFQKAEGGPQQQSVTPPNADQSAYGANMGNAKQQPYTSYGAGKDMQKGGGGGRGRGRR